MRQTYDFFSNPKVSSSALLAPHYEQTIERIKNTNCDYILSIQDGTVLNFTSHKAKKEEIGRIGRSGKTEQYGLIQHSNLLVTNTNEPLGLIDLSHFHYDDFDISIDHHLRNIENKKNICWINSFKNMERLTVGCNKKIITVADRESDFFEFLNELRNKKSLYVIRAKNNRYTGENHRDRNTKLFDMLESADILGSFQTTLNDVETHQVKQVEFSIKKIKNVLFPQPYRSAASSQVQYTPITTNALMVYNDDYRWVLLTNLELDTFGQCCEIIEIYKSRWHIEDYHKILKTAYQIDEIYLHSSRKAIENALTMMSISACRFYWMVYVGRVEKNIGADKIFKEYEWKAPFIFLKEKIPDKPPPLAEVIIKIARMGGYKVTKNASPPGIKVMWLGFQAFTIASLMCESLLPTKT
jgi:Transposase Tn5 dimerisation domain